MSWPGVIVNINKFHYDRGGSERYYFDLEGMLGARGHRVVSFSMASARNRPSPHARFFVDEVDWESAGAARRTRLFAGMIHSREAARRIEALLDAEGGDLAHLHNISHQLSPSILAPLRRRGIPIVQTLHDYKLICPNYRLFTQGHVCERCRGGKYWNALAHRCNRNEAGASLAIALEAGVHRATGVYQRGIDLFIAPSRFMMEKTVAFGVPQERIRLVPNPITAAREAKGGTSGGTRDYLLYSGRLTAEKGLLTLLDAAARTPGIALHIAGDGELRAIVAEKASRIPHVTLLGHRTRAEMDRLVAGARAVIVPSEWYENSPLSVLEAFAAATPVIAARIGGLPELVIEGRTGYLFDPGDVAMLADRMRRVIENPAEAAQLGRHARDFVAERHGPDRHYASLLECYTLARDLARRGEPWRWRKAS